MNVLQSLIRSLCFFIFFLSIIKQHVFLYNIFSIHRLDVFLYFHSQKHYYRWSSFFSILWMSLILTGNFMSLKSSLFAKSLSDFVVLFGLWSAGFKHLTKHHLKHSKASIFWILINPFPGRSNSLGNFI